MVIYVNISACKEATS